MRLAWIYDDSLAELAGVILIGRARIQFNSLTQLAVAVAGAAVISVSHVDLRVVYDIQGRQTNDCVVLEDEGLSLVGVAYRYECLPEKRGDRKFLPASVPYSKGHFVSDWRELLNSVSG